MRKANVSISNPDDLNKHLQYSSPLTWIVLGATVLAMLAFFVWACIYRIPVKISGTAIVVSGQATLNVDGKSLDKLKAGQKVHVSNQEGVLSFDEENKPVVLNLTLDDDEYPYYIVINEIKPIDFVIK